MKRNLSVLKNACIILFLLLSAHFSQAQNNFKVSGKITDDSGKPVDGATVQVKGTSTATATKTDGSFELMVPSERSVLVISHVGFLDRELALDGKSDITLILTPLAGSLEDVVVVGYGTRKKLDVTGSVSSINSEKIRSVPTTNVTQALQGRIAGIEAAPSSFRPGAGARIRIRGNRSLFATNDPLYVVDGIPVTYTIDDINPLDIESIDVLKDASATAIYGVRGANGVVQITTKKGKAGKVTIDYNGSVGFDNMLKDIPVFNGPELVDSWRQAFHADRAYNFAQNTTSPNLYFPDAASDVKLFGGNYYMWEAVRNAYQFRVFDRTTNTYIAFKRATTPEEKALLGNLGLQVLDSVDAYDPSKITSYPWQDEFKRQGVTNSHSISVTAGSDKIRSSFSGSYFKQKGVEYGFDYTRYTVGNNNEFKPAKFITFGNSVSYTNSIQNGTTNMYGNASGMLPISQPYDTAGKFLLYPNGDQQIINAANDVNTVFNQTKVSRIMGNVFAEITFLKGLRYKAVFGIDSRNARQGTFNGAQSSVRQGNLANASHAITNSMSWVFDNLIYYDFKIKNDHSFNVTLLHEMQSLNKQDQLTMSAQNLIFEEQKWFSLQRNNLATVTGSGTYTASQLESFMGRIEYGFRNKYLLTVSNRYDNSSVLAEGKKGEFFPSAAFAWRIDNEDFFRKQQIITNAKIRLGIGRVGNSSIDPYQTNGPLEFTNYNWLNGNAAIGASPLTFPVPDLTWEKTTTKNLGLEFGLLRNRVNATVDIYQSTTRDMLQRLLIPATNGVTYMLVNLGEVRNKGVDISLSTININSKSGLRWTTDIVFSKNKEAIINIDNSPNNNLANLFFIGQPIRVYYNYQSQGIFQYSDTARGGILTDYFRKKLVNYNPATATTRAASLFNPGRIRVRDVNGDTLIDGNDKMILGYDNADWTGSIANTVSFKGFELNFLIYIRKGGMYRAPRPGLVGRYQSNKVNYWTPTNPSNEYQQPTRTSDVPTYWEALGYRKGSFARVRNISLTYRFPASILSKLKANSLSVYINAVNPFLFHKHSDYDPETIPYAEQFAATTNNTGPNSYSFRSMVFGVRIGL
ncbi:MAG: TonB-dependent receptor [Chitinophagaceae bacterium]|nr:TonB-dependent receptor [Chitinophagaceae bacterium]